MKVSDLMSAGKTSSAPSFSSGARTTYAARETAAPYTTAPEQAPDRFSSPGFDIDAEMSRLKSLRTDAEREQNRWSIFEDSIQLGGFTPKSLQPIDSKYKSAAEAQSIVDKYNAQIRELANLNYEKNLGTQMSGIKANTSTNSALTDVKNMRELERKIYNAYQQSEIEGIDRSDASLRALGRHYGLTEAETKNIWTMKAATDARMAAARKTLTDAGYDFDEVLYEVNREWTAKDAATKKTELTKDLQGSNRAKVVHSALSVLASPGQGVDYAAQVLSNWGRNDPTKLDTYRPMNSDAMSATNYVTTVRGVTGEEIGKKSKVGKFAYDVGMSIADNAMLTATLGFAGFGYAGVGTLISGIMGSSAAAVQMKSILDSGGSNEQAIAGGLAAGVAEALFEKVSVDRLLDPKVWSGWKNTDLMKRWVKETLKQGGVEASEEICTELANLYTDAMIRGKDSDFQRSISAYIADGMTPEDAKKQAALDAIGQVALAGLSGFVSGGVMGGSRGAVAAATYKSDINKLGAAVTEYAGQSGEIAKGLAAAEGTEARKLAEQAKKTFDTGAKVDAGLMGALTMANNAEADAAMVAASNVGGETAEAILQKAATERQTSGTLTPETLAQLKAVASAYESMSPAATPSAQELAVRVQVTRAQNPEADVLDAATSMILEAKVTTKLVKAKEKAGIIQKLINGEEVSPVFIRKLDPTNKTMQAVFTQLTGVQFPDGKLTDAELFDLYRSAHAVAVKAVADRDMAAMMGDETDVDESGLLDYQTFADRYREVRNPDANEEELLTAYAHFVQDAATVDMGDQSLTHDQFVKMLKSAPGGDQLTATEAAELWFTEVERTRASRAEQRKTAEAGEKARQDSLKLASEAIDRALKPYGLSTVVEYDMPDNDNAFVDPQGVIHFNGNVLTTEKAMIFVLGHELVHRTNPQFVQGILDAFDTLNQKGLIKDANLKYQVENRDERLELLSETYLQHLAITAKKRNPDLNIAEYKKQLKENGVGEQTWDEYITEEYAADLMRSVFGQDADVLTKLAAENAAPVKESLNWVKKLKNKFGRKDPAEQEIQQVLQDLEAKLIESLKNAESGVADDRTPADRHSVSTMLEAINLDVETKDGVGRIVVRDARGEVVTEVTEAMVRNSRLGAVLRESVNRGRITEEKMNKQITFFKDFTNQLLNTQAIDVTNMDAEFLFRYRDELTGAMAYHGGENRAPTRAMEGLKNPSRVNDRSKIPEIAAKSVAEIEARRAAGERHSVDIDPELRYTLTPYEAEQNIRRLENQIQEIEEQLDFADFDDISAEEQRKLRNRLVKLHHELDTARLEEGKHMVPTSLQTVLDSLDRYRRMDLELIANQLTDDAWDEVEDLPTEALMQGIRDIIAEWELSPLEMQATKFGVRVRAPETARHSITPEFEQWYRETYGREVKGGAEVKQRLQKLETRAKAAEFKGVLDKGEANRAWEIHHKKELREQKREFDAKLDAARKAKTQAVRDAVTETKEIERAKAAVQHDADRMAERRAAAKRLRTKENAYRTKISNMKENQKLQRNAAKATLRTARLAAKKRAAIETAQGPVNTIRQNPKELSAMEKRQAAANALRTLGRTAYRNFVNMAEAIDRFGKRQVSGVRAGTLVNIAGGSASTVESIFKTGLVNREGDRIGGSMKEVFLCWDGKKVDEEKQAILQDYMLHAHNVDRMSFVANAEAALSAFEDANPWLRDMDTKEFARLTAMTDKETEKTGKFEARAKALEYATLLRRRNEAQNKPIFADENGNDVTADTSREICEKYLAENPWLEEKAQGIYEWWDLFMRNWAVGDTISEAEYETMRATYPHYVPTYRVGKNGVGGANFVGAGGATVSKAVKRAKGSHEQVMNIEDSFTQIVSKIVRLNRVNELYMNIIDTAMLDDDGTFADMAYFDWDWQDSAYGNALITGSASIVDLTDSIDNAEKAGLEKVGSDYKLTGWLNGRKYTAYISEDLYKSIGMVTGHLANDFEKNLLKIGNTLTSPMKTFITGINPSFALRNITRDFPTAVINSISGIAFPKYYAQAAKEMAKNSENWQRFQALGGTHSGYYNNEKGFAKDMMAKNLWKQARQKAGWFNEVTEAQTRFAEYLATIDRLGDTYENRLQGIKNSAEVTVDFSRKGRYGKVINAWVPYWNPAVQGIDKTVRSVIDSPDGSAIWKQASKTLGRAALTTVLWEAVAFAIRGAFDRDDEWEELSDRVKDTYYCIPLKDSKTFLKIPKNREWGAILGTPFMRMLEWANGREDPFENYLETAIEPNFLPPAIFRPDAGSDGFTSDIIGIAQALDLARNKDFAGRTIVPYAYQQGSKTEQYDSETSWFAKQLGKLFNFSPMQIDYIIEDYFGDIGELITTAAAKATWTGEQNFVESSVELLTNPWVADARYSNQAVSKYYDLMDKLDRTVQDRKNQLGNDAYKDTIEYQTQKAVDTLYGKAITELNAEVRDMPDGTEKDNAKAQIAQLTREAIEYYEDCMSGKVNNPIRDAEYADFSGDLRAELIRMDGYTEDYKFTPTGNPASSYVDPRNKKNEYILTEDQKDYFEALYREQYDEIFGELIRSQKYRSAKDDRKAKLLADTRGEVLDATKDLFFDWLKKTGVRSTPKKK